MVEGYDAPGTRANYAAEQQNAARQSGTKKGKRAVRTFLHAVRERFSDGVPEGYIWEMGYPWGRMQGINNLFWKWVMEVPPWGTPEYNAIVVTSVFSWDRTTGKMQYRGTVDNLFRETERDWLMNWAARRLLRMAMRDVERKAMWKYSGMVARRLLGVKRKER